MFEFEPTLGERLESFKEEAQEAVEHFVETIEHSELAHVRAGNCCFFPLYLRILSFLFDAELFTLRHSARR
jgi:hypothetical protein